MLKLAVAQVLDRLRLARDPIAYARSLGVAVGSDCRFLGSNPGTFGSEPYLIRIGDHVTITSGVRFVTHDGGVWVLRAKYPDMDVVGGITIHDNVFVGLGSILLPGIEIGPNSVVGAGSVVNRTIPPNTVAAGVPCRPVSTLDDYEARVVAKAVHIKFLSPAEKQRFLIADRRTS